MAPIKGSEYCPQVGKELKSGAFWRDCFAEMIATFLLVAAQLVLLQNWQPVPNGQALGIQVALGMAFVGASVGYGLGDFGGAHMNPAVTMTMIVRAEITIIKGIFYWALQIAGGILAAFFVFAVTPTAQLVSSGLGNTMLGAGVLWWQGLLIEITITTILCLAALATASVSRKGYIILPSIPVGLALGLGLFLALNSTGASMNPARSLGPCVVGSSMMGMTGCWTYHWIYWVGPMLGALLAAVLYWIFDSVDRTKMTGTPTVSPYNSTNTWAYTTAPTPAKEQQQPIVTSVYPTVIDTNGYVYQ